MRWWAVIAIVVWAGLAEPAAAGDDVGLLRALGVQTRESFPGMGATLPDGSVLFSAHDGVHGRELWRSDGTAAGTRLVADVLPGPESSAPAALEVIGETVYFWARDDNGASEIWRSDGTQAGTRRLVSFAAPASTSAARATETDLPRRGFQPLGDDVTFVVRHRDGDFLGATGPEGGLRELDVLPPGETTELTLRASTPDGLYFTHNRRLYRTDGTRAGTLEIERESGVEELVTVGAHVAITGYNLDRGWLVSTIAPGATRATVLTQGSSVMRSIGGRLYFGSQTGLYTWAPGETVRFISSHAPAEVVNASHGVYEMTRTGGTLLWASRDEHNDARLFSWDGTTVRAVGGTSFEPVGLTPISGSRALFWAYGESNQLIYRLWVTDGTAAGTRRLTEAVSGAHTILATPHGALYPDYTQMADTELHRSDGTPEGTGLLVDINRVPKGSGPLEAARVGARVVFRTVEGGALWATDGTATGTQRLPLATVPYGIASDGATAFFGGHDGGLYRTDGTAGGTQRIAGAAIKGPSFTGFGRIGGAFTFAAEPTGEPLDLWRTDGTAAGTRRMNQELYSFPRTAAIGPRALLISTDYALVRTDGTAASTVFGVPKSSLSDAVVVDDGFVSLGHHPDTGLELFHLDPDGANPRLIADIYEGTPGSRPRAFGRVGDKVLFTAGEYLRPNLWYVTDGETVTELTGMIGVPSELAPATVDGVTYIVNQQGEDTLLYRTDGTATGTILLRRFRYGFVMRPEHFTGFNGTTWFSAGDLDHGQELWRTDGTPAGTKLVLDIAPGRQSSEPLDFVATDDFLFFTAYDPLTGAEPWRIRRTTPPVDPPDEPETDPPVTIEPVLPTPDPPAPAQRPAPLTAPAPKPTLSIRVQRLRKLQGRARWRVSGTAKGAACGGGVRIVLGRRDRALKTFSARLSGCAYRAIVTSTSRSSGRWLQVRTVPGGVTSRRVSVR